MTSRAPSRARDLLTPRQREMLTLLYEGRRPVAIAATLTLSVATVHSTLRDAYRRLGASGGFDALALAQAYGVFADRTPPQI